MNFLFPRTASAWDDRPDFGIGLQLVSKRIKVGVANSLLPDLAEERPRVLDSPNRIGLSST